MRLSWLARRVHSYKARCRTFTTSKAPSMLSATPLRCTGRRKGSGGASPAYDSTEAGVRSRRPKKGKAEASAASDEDGIVMIGGMNPALRAISSSVIVLTRVTIAASGRSASVPRPPSLSPPQLAAAAAARERPRHTARRRTASAWIRVADGCSARAVSSAAVARSTSCRTASCALLAAVAESPASNSRPPTHSRAVAAREQSAVAGARRRKHGGGGWRAIALGSGASARKGSKVS